MENSICVDTDILVDFLRNKEHAVKWFLKNKDKNLAITIINLFELYYGAYKSNKHKENLKSIEVLLYNLKVLNLSIEIVNNAAKQYAKLEKEGMPLEFRDIFMGAITLNNGFTLKTKNKRHFERIEGLKLV
jgi:tRNA(fMet)-specific endonuclease VapC